MLSQESLRKPALERLSERGALVRCRIEGRRETFYALPHALELLDRPARAPHARFIAPLDNLLWDRDMVEALFGFKYRWEVYTPLAKRQYGYYVLPVLYGNRFVARFDPEPASRAGQFRVKSWWWEDGIRPSRTMLAEIEREMRRFAAYLGMPSAPENMDAVRREVR